MNLLFFQALMVLHLVWPFYTVHEVKPMDVRFDHVEPYASGGAYAEFSDMTIRVNARFFEYPLLWQAAGLAHEEQHLRDFGTKYQAMESTALTVHAMFLSDAGGPEDWIQYVWRLQADAVRRERAAREEEAKIEAGD